MGSSKSYLMKETRHKLRAPRVLTREAPSCPEQGGGNASDAGFNCQARQEFPGADPSKRAKKRPRAVENGAASYFPR
jgi:hypothetical protein